MTFKSRLGLAISYLMVSLHQSLQRLQVGALHSLNEVTPETYEIVTLGSKLRHVLPDLMRLLGRPQHNDYYLEDLEEREYHCEDL